MHLSPNGFEVADLPRAKHADETLVRMLAKAWRWQQWLEGGRHRSIRELAEAERVSHSCVSRVLRLTLLAPDLVEAILDGRQPRGLTAQELLRGVPVGWMVSIGIAAPGKIGLRSGSGSGLRLREMCRLLGRWEGSCACHERASRVLVRGQRGADPRAG